MNFFRSVLLVCLAAACFLPAILAVRPVIDENSITAIERDHFSQFKSKYSKQYSDSKDEAFRLGVFVENLRKIFEHNARNVSFSVKMNRFGDWTGKEYVQFLKTSSSKKSKFLKSAEESELPSYPYFENSSHVDWRKKGAVTGVKDQGQCGSCYSFSATGALEGQHFLKYGKLISLSEQQLVDCSWKQGNQGCDGGFVEYCYDYLMVNGSMPEASYSYSSEEGDCSFNKSEVVTRVSKYFVLAISEQELTKKLKKNGPVAVAIDASQWSFQFYESGVYDEPMCKKFPWNLDHAVLAVGYGTDKKTDQDFYIVKNSWGEDWGEEGYIKMSRNKKNQCGIATDAVLPIVI